MKFLHTSALLFLLLLSMAGCQRDDDFLIREEAFSMIVSGYNGSSNNLEITIDTMTLRDQIQANASFKRTDKYTFSNGQDQVNVVIKEKNSGKVVYEKQVKKGEYSLTIDLIYINGKLIEKPGLPAGKEGFRQVSYLFIPSISGYSGDIDIVYFRKYEVFRDGMLVIESMEELARVSAKPYAFSPFLQGLIFPGGRQEIDGKVYIINQDVKCFKAGTNIPYYEDAGFSAGQYANFPLLNSTKPEYMGVLELGSAADKYIEGYTKLQF